MVTTKEQNGANVALLDIRANGEKQLPVVIDDKTAEQNIKDLEEDNEADHIHVVGGPPDRLNMVFILLLVHGIGTLLPWNVFITVRPYFTDYKFDGPLTEYSKNFLSYLGIASQMPNVLLNLLNLFVPVKASLSLRIKVCLLINAAILVITICFAFIDSSTWPDTFFVITMISVVVLNGSNGVYQNSIYGVAADLPAEYSNAVVFGTNISGTFVSLLYIVTKLASPDELVAAVSYFSVALIIVIICFTSYFFFPRFRFYRYWSDRGREQRIREEERTRLLDEKKKEIDSSGCLPHYFQSYIDVLKQGWVQMWNVFFIFLVSLCIFPAMQAEVARVSDSFPIPDGYFAAVTCFLLFNFFAMLGNLFANYVQWPGPKYLWIPVLLRGLFIPAFMLCNYRPDYRTFPVVFNNDYIYIVFGIVMSWTSGYFSSLVMMYAPRVVHKDLSRLAGMMAACFLILGICVGVNLTLCVAYINENLGWLTPALNDTTVATTMVNLLNNTALI